MFLGGAQIDSRGNTNLTCIGDYQRPKIKLPGGAATSFLTPLVKKLILWTTHHSKRVFVDRLDFLTGLGYEEGKDKEVTIITDKAVFMVEKEYLVLKSVHKDVSVKDVVENTSFAPIVGKYGVTTTPTSEDMVLIRKLDPDGIRFSEFEG